MNCIIIDDEKHCIKTLSRLLEASFVEIKVVATCDDAALAHDLIQLHQPDFIFLDIEMPKLNGFDLLSKFDNLFFDVIFTTAYDTYALKAIKYSALDYLLKPVGKEELAIAIKKLKSKISPISQAQIELATAVRNRQMPDTIALPTAEGLAFTYVNDIVYCMADGSYSRVFMIDKSEILISKTLGDVEELLSEYNFFRIHHSSLINLKQVKKYIRGDGGEVIMSNGQTITVARTRKNDFLNVFTRF